jgi:hypothetical protein
MFISSAVCLVMMMTESETDGSEKCNTCTVWLEANNGKRGEENMKI